MLDLTLSKYLWIKVYKILIVIRMIITQITLTVATRVADSVMWASVSDQEDVTAIVKSSASSALRPAFVELLYLHTITLWLMIRNQTTSSDMPLMLQDRITNRT